MALVQHRLDGLEQRCARRAKSVLQCPVRRRADDDTAHDAGRAQDACAAPGPSTSTGTPSSPPAPTRARPTPRAGATRSFAPAPTTGARLRRYFASFAHSPTASDSMRCATPSINACTCSGRCSSPVAMSTHSSAPRSVSIAASNASNRPMASAHSRRALDSSRLALRRRTLSCARILPNRPSASPSRSIAP